MILTTYSLVWTDTYTAELSWDGGSSDGWFTVYVDGKSSTVYGSGTLSLSVSLNEKENHSITIVQHEGDPVDKASPDSERLLRPTVRWKAVENAAEYLVYELDEEGDEVLVRQEPAVVDAQVYSWELPVDLPKEGLSVYAVRVYARGSWGRCATPSIVSGFLCGHPARASKLSTQVESDGTLELILEHD